MLEIKMTGLPSERLVAIITVVSLVTGWPQSLSAQSVSEQLQEKYLSALDQWVRNGGRVDVIQDEVVQNCGKLVMLTANKIEAAKFLSTDREEFDFRVDVCTKMTVNRVHKQPEFEKPEIVKSICSSKIEVFKTLCVRSGLK